VLGPRLALPEETVDEMLIRNCGPRIAAAVAQADLAGAKRLAIQLLRRLSAPQSLRAGFFLLMDAFCGQAEKGDADAALNACLSTFPTSDPLREEAAYYAVLYCYEKENYDVALKRSVAFSAEYPGSRQGVPAQMLAALCLIRLEKYPEALRILVTVTTTSPDSPEAPKAFFLTAWIYVFTQENDKARPVLESLQKKYPDSQYAAKATQLLESLKTPK
jgi:tetratricopeptide (TPR) repeat protein